MTPIQDTGLLPVTQEVESGDCQIDDTFTGLCNRVKESGMRFAAETARLRDVLHTLAVNARRTTAPLDLVAWMADHLDDIIAGKSLYDAAWNTRAEQPKPSGEVERLREALKPFAAVADEYDESEDDGLEVWIDAGPVRAVRASFRLEYYRRARAAIAALSERGAVGEEVDALAARLRDCLERIQEGGRPLPWVVHSGCSFRRIASEPTSENGFHSFPDGNVLHAYNQRSDNHPDLSMGERQLNALVEIINSVPNLLAALSSIQGAGANSSGLADTPAEKG